MFADGNPQARLMFVGEAPGREEDLEGVPFVGRSGQLLDLMLAPIGLDRTRPTSPTSFPGVRPATARRRRRRPRSACPSSLRQIELVNPDILVCLGGPSAQTLLNTRDGITPHARPLVHAFHTGTREIRALATLHPAYLLRQPLESDWRGAISWRSRRPGEAAAAVSDVEKRVQRLVRSLEVVAGAVALPGRRIGPAWRR